MFIPGFSKDGSAVVGLPSFDTDAEGVDAGATEFAELNPDLVEARSFCNKDMTGCLYRVYPIKLNLCYSIVYTEIALFRGLAMSLQRTN